MNGPTPPRDGAPAAPASPAAPPEAWFDEVVRAEKEVLQELRRLAEELAPSAPHGPDAEKLFRHLDDLFLIVVVGEVKSGKSALINALLGRRVQKEGPTPVTDRIHLIRDGEPSGAPVPRGDHVVEVTVRSPLLSNTSVVDTPGTNSIIREHQSITEGFIPRADLVLFVTSIDRPLAESERGFLEFIRHEWGKKVVVILSKVDTRDASDVAEVLQYLREAMERLLGFRPRIFPVSARLGLSAKESGAPEALARSGLEALEAAIQKTLRDEERLKLKLMSPLTSAERVCHRLDGVLEARADRIRADTERIEAFRRRVREAGEAITRPLDELPAPLAETLATFEARGEQFLAQRFHPLRFRLYRDADQVASDFRREVWAGLEEDLERAATSTAESLLRESVRLWEHGVRFLGEMNQGGPPGGVAPAFESRRAEALRALREGYRSLLREFDLKGESQRVSAAAYGGAVGLLGAEAGAAAIGVAAIAMHSLLFGVGGVVIAGCLAALGFTLLPMRRSRAIQRFRQRSRALREQIRVAFQREATAAAQEAVQRTLETAAPFDAWRRSEEDRWAQDRRRLDELKQRLAALRSRIAPDQEPDDVPAR